MIKKWKGGVRIMANKKIACLGGGSTYFAGVLADLATTEELKGSEVVLYDIDLERANLMVKCGQRLSEEAEANFKIYATGDLQKAVDGADFAIGNIGGVGGKGGGFYKQGGVHMNDLLISAKYGIYQIVGDTCGPAAMMAAFRTIPIYLNICREMEKRAPNVIFINHANPMAILCRSINKYSNLENVIGICHGVQEGIRYIAEILEVPPEELDTTWIGTNHYYWFTEIYHRGKNLYPELKIRMALRKPPEESIMHAKLSVIYDYQIVYPDDSHIIEFYPFLAQVKDYAHLPYELARSHHGQVVAKIYSGQVSKADLTGESIIEEYKETLNKMSLPKQEKDSMAESLGSLIGAIIFGRRHIHIVNIPNKGAVPNLPDTAILEVEGVTDSHSIRPIYIGEAPLVLKGQLEKIIAWQELVVDAGVKGDKKLALQSLMLDPQAILPEKAEKMLDELLANSRELLPQFK